MFEMTDIDAGPALPPVIEEDDSSDTLRVPLVHCEPHTDDVDIVMVAGAGGRQPLDVPDSAGHPSTSVHTFSDRVRDDLREIREPCAQSPRQYQAAM